MTKKTLIVDGYNLFIRMSAAMNTVNYKGYHVGGLIGFLKTLAYFSMGNKPTRIIIVFDGDNPYTYRRNLYPEYKTNRKNGLFNKFVYHSKDEERESTVRQIDRLGDYLSVLPVLSLKVDKVEADDVIAYLCHIVEGDKIIMSTDEDFFQLVNEHVGYYSSKKKIILGVNDIYKKTGIYPCNQVTYKSMFGDKSDNIKGVPHFGDKKIRELFPELHKPYDFSVDDLIYKSKSLSDKDKNYETVYSMRHIITRNERLVNLRGSFLLDSSINEIKDKVNDKVRNYNPSGFEEMTKMDYITDHFSKPLSTFISNCFGHLTFY